MTTQVITENTGANIRNSYDETYTGQTGSYMRSDFPDSGTNGEAVLTCEYVTSGTVSKHPIILFDLSNIPADQTITSAILEMEVTSGTGTAQDLLCRRVLRSGIAFATMTWNEYVEFGSWNTPGCQGDGTDRVAAATDTVSGLATTTGTLAQWDVTSDVADMYAGTVNNYGWLIDFDGTTQFDREFGSAAATDGDRPELIIVYGTGEVAATPGIEVVRTIPGVAH